MHAFEGLCFYFKRIMRDARCEVLFWIDLMVQIWKACGDSSQTENLLSILSDISINAPAEREGHKRMLGKLKIVWRMQVCLVYLEFFLPTPYVMTNISCKHRCNCIVQTSGNLHLFPISIVVQSIHDKVQSKIYKTSNYFIFKFYFTFKSTSPG